MAIYEFKCDDCNLIEEKLQKYDDPAPTCINCGKEMKRLISTQNLRFRGGGWATINHHKDTGDFAD